MIADNSPASGIAGYTVQSHLTLVEGTQKFQPKKTQIASRLLAANPGRNGGRFAGNAAQATGRRGRRCGYRELDDLIGLQNVSRGDTRASGADIQRLGKLDKFRPGNILAANEHGNLEFDTWRASRWRKGQALPCLKSGRIHES